MPEPTPTGRRLEKLEIERRLDDATQRAPRVGAEGVVSSVSEFTLPCRSMPSSVFVAA